MRPLADSITQTATSRTLRCVWLEMCASRSKATWSPHPISSMRMPLACSMAARLAIALRNCSTSVDSRCTWSSAGGSSRLSLTSTASPLSAVTVPLPSVSGSQTSRAVRCCPSARSTRYSRTNGVPAVPAARSASRRAGRSLFWTWASSSPSDGSMEPGGTPWSE